MKEQLYTIPVTDAFNSDCECPLCKMKAELEQNAIEYTLGPSYMEDDNRALTDQMGFCDKHIQTIYQQKNRLGLALILSTHIAKTTKDLKELANNSTLSATKGFLKKKAEPSVIGNYVDTLSHTCFICNRIEKTFDRYIDTIFHMYKRDKKFVESLSGSKGFCTYHYALLYDKAPDFLTKETLSEFIERLNNVYFTNMERMQEDIEWFINKFDYRFQNESWKNSKDALPRSILKTHSGITPDLAKDLENSK